MFLKFTCMFISQRFPLPYYLYGSSLARDFYMLSQSRGAASVQGGMKFLLPYPIRRFPAPPPSTPFLGCSCYFSFTNDAILCLFIPLLTITHKDTVVLRTPCYFLLGPTAPSPSKRHTSCCKRLKLTSSD